MLGSSRDLPKENNKSEIIINTSISFNDVKSMLLMVMYVGNLSVNTPQVKVTVHLLWSC